MSRRHTLPQHRPAFAAALALVLAALLLSSPPALAQSPPGPVSSVSLSRADGTLTASWDAVPGATKYHVTYSSNGGASWSLAALDHTENSITFSADNAKTYIVGARAGNDHGWSGWVNSPPAGPYTPTPPGTPSSVTITRADGSLTATWPAPAGATSYHVTYSDNDKQSWQLAALDHPADADGDGNESITISADNAKTYVVGVRAKNSDGGSNWRNSPAAGPYTPPTPRGIIVQDSSGNAITALSVPEGGEASYQVKLTTAPSEDVEVCIGLSVRDNNDPDITFKGEASDVAALKLTFTPSNWNTAQTVTLVAAEDNDYLDGARDVTHDARDWYGGRVDWTATEVDNDEPAAPAAPSGLSARPGDRRVILTWDDPGDPSITGYEYRTRWAGVAWSDWTAMPASDASTNSFRVSGLENGAEYRFKIRAVNSVGASRPAPLSAPWYVAATPAPPTLTADDATDNSVTLTIGNWSGAWHYRAQGQAAGASGASGAGIASGQSGCVGPITGSETTITGLDPNSSYTINAYAQCGGATIASAAASTLPPAPGAVAKPAAAPKFSGAEVTWTAPTGTVTGYEVQWRPCQVTFATTNGGCVTYTEAPPDNDPDNRTPVPAWAPWGTGTHLHGSSGTVAVAASASPHTVTNLNNGVRYQLRVRASYTTGNGTSYGPWSTPSDDVWPNTQYSLTASNVTGSEATLTVAVSSGGSWRYQSWYYKADQAPHASCSAGQSATTVTVTGLTEHVSYTYTAYTDSGCKDELAHTAAFTTSGDDLTAGSVTDTTATLTLAGHTGNWWLKRTQPAGTACDAMGTAATKDLTGLTSSTAYVYTAYNDSACTTMIDSAAFTTLPGSPANVGASISTANVITVDWDRPAGETGGLGYEVERGVSSTWTACATVAATSDAALSATCTYSGPSSSAPTKVRVRSSRGATNGPWTEADFVGVPRDLAASYGSGVLTVTWKPPEGPSSNQYGYHVESSADGSAWTRRHTIALTSGTSFSRTVSVGGIAEVRVRATDSSGDASAWTEADVPAPVSVGAQVRGTTLYLRWEKPAGASGSLSYTISCNNATTGATGWDDACGTAAATANATITASAAGKGSVKRVRVSATQNSVAGPWSAAAAVPSLVPGAPATLDVTVSTGGGTGGGNALTNVQWTKPAGSTVDYAYEITCSDDNGSTWTYCGATPHTVAVGGTLAVNFNGKDATTNVRVVAIRDNLRGTAASWAKTPGAPADVGAQIQGTTLKLRWDRPSVATGALGYTVGCNNSASGGTWDDTCHTVTGSSDATLTASVSGKGSVQRVRVKATQAGVDGAWTTVAVPSGVPGAVGSLGAQVQGTTLNVRWDRPSGATTAISYTVECNDSATGTTGWASCHTETATSDTVLTASVDNKGSVKRVRVRAERDGLQGAWTAGAVPSGLPAAPSSVSLTKIGTTSYATVGKPSGVTGAVAYRVQCSTDNGATWTACNITFTSGDATYQLSLPSSASSANVVRARVERDGLVSGWERYPASLTASSVTGITATLSLGGRTGSWWLKKTAPAPEGPCTAGEADFSHALTSLTDGTTYTYKAYRASGCAGVDWIASGTFTTPESLTASSFTTTGATLTIAGHTGDWYYEGDVGPDNSCKGPVTTTTKALTGLTAGTTYTYKAYSDSTCASANLLGRETFTTKLNPPQNLGAQYQDGSLKVWWDKPSGAQSTDSFSYTVDCSTSTSAPYTWTSTHCATVAAITDAAASATISTAGYKRVRVRAANSGANSGWVESAVPSGTPPGAPTGPSVTFGGSLGGGQFWSTIAWTKPSSPTGAVGYEVQCSADASTQPSNWFACKTVAATTTTNLSYQVNTDIHNTPNYIRVRSVVSGLVSAWVESPNPF